MTETKALWLLRTVGRALVTRGRRFLISLAVASLLAARGVLAGVSTFGEYDPGNVGRDHGITVDQEGYVYVAEGYTKRVRKFDEAGHFVGQLGTQESDGDQSYYPTDVVVDSSGNIYVTESSPPFQLQVPQDGRLKKFDHDGNVLWTVPIPFQTFAVAIDPAGKLYAVPFGTGNEVTQYDRTDGGVLSQWSWGDGPGSGPMDLATDPAGNLYLGMPGRVDLVDPLGHALGSLPVATSSYVHVATDSLGNLYALSEDGLLTKFSARHEPLNTLHLGAYGGGGWYMGVAASPSGLVYVLGQRDVLRIDPSTPSASLAVAPTLALTGDQVAFDASGSSAPLSTITRYEWDLDGDGTFETDTGATPVASRSYAERGDIRVSVRVTAESGITDTAEAALTVLLASPPGPVGVSINAGAQFTNDPNVTISVRWPAFATSVLIANDGGFTDAVAVPVDASIAWTLDSSGPERLPKTIYVRFQGGESGPETYQDDIILDQTPPTIEGVRAAVRGSGDARGYRLSIRASDELSGVAQMQITNDTSEPGDIVPFEPKTQVRTRSRKLLVRVQDLAGNFSPWRKVRR
jgi:sugar lactone lactonase YvrE